MKTYISVRADEDRAVVTVHDSDGIKHEYKMQPGDNGELRITAQNGSVLIEPIMANVLVLHPSDGRAI